jgi:hypothetical protein
MPAWSLMQMPPAYLSHSVMCCVLLCSSGVEVADAPGHQAPQLSIPLLRQLQQLTYNSTRLLLLLLLLDAFDPHHPWLHTTSSSSS